MQRLCLFFHQSKKKKAMNKIGLQLLVIFLGMNTWLLSQCCPYITSVEVLPQNPNESDAIRVATYISTPGNGS